MALSLHKVTLSLRVLSVAFQLTSIILLSTNNKKFSDNNGKPTSPSTFISYRIMFGNNAIGGGYNLLQIISCLIFRILMNNDSDVYNLLEFYGDKAVSYLLASGSAAGFGAIRDLKRCETYNNIGSFFNMGYASAILLLLAFLCSAIVSILSSYSFLKKVHVLASHPNPH